MGFSEDYDSSWNARAMSDRCDPFGNAPPKPFTVEIDGGDAFRIDCPEAIILRGGVARYIEAGGSPHRFDHKGVTRLIGGNLAQAG